MVRTIEELNAMVEVGEDRPPCPGSDSIDSDSTGPVAIHECIPLSEIKRPDPSQDDSELIKFRFLCRGGGLLMPGPSGIGKSSLSMQLMLSWALGKSCFGLCPAKPLKSLLVQAENDPGDIAEFRDGILKGMGLSQEEAQQACSAILTCHVNDSCGDGFFEILPPLLEKHRPDILWLDPLLAYLGGDVCRQEIVSPWLRNKLNPLLCRFQCGAVIIHHTNKPPSGKEKPDWAAGDFAYLGSGSAELANWPRAVMAIRSIGDHDAFELKLGKRGRRVGWQNEDGTPRYETFIAHSQSGICWQEVTLKDPESGRPKSVSVEKLVGLLKGTEKTAPEWFQLAKDELGMSQATFYRLKSEAEDKELVFKSKVSNKWNCK